MTQEKFSLGFITSPDRENAHLLADKIIGAKLAACVSVIPSVYSVYRWQGKIEKSSEHLLIVKAPGKNAAKITALVKKYHPYTVCEVVFFDISAGNPGYLKWIGESCR